MFVVAVPLALQLIEPEVHAQHVCLRDPKVGSQLAQRQHEAAAEDVDLPAEKNERANHLPGIRHQVLHVEPADLFDLAARRFQELEPLLEGFLQIDGSFHGQASEPADLLALADQVRKLVDPFDAGQRAVAVEKDVLVRPPDLASGVHCTTFCS